MSTDEIVEIETGPGEPMGSVSWLQGRGAEGHDFRPVVPV